MSGAASSAAREEIRLRVQRLGLREALPGLGDRSCLGLDPRGHEPEPPVGVVALECLFDRALSLVDPAAELVHERQLEVRRRCPGLNAPRRLRALEGRRRAPGAHRLLAPPDLHRREQRDRLGDDEPEGDRRRGHA